MFDILIQRISRLLNTSWKDDSVESREIFMLDNNLERNCVEKTALPANVGVAKFIRLKIEDFLDFWVYLVISGVKSRLKWNGHCVPFYTLKTTPRLWRHWRQQNPTYGKCVNHNLCLSLTRNIAIINELWHVQFKTEYVNALPLMDSYSPDF